MSRPGSSSIRPRTANRRSGRSAREETAVCSAPGRHAVNHRQPLDRGAVEAPARNRFLLPDGLDSRCAIPEVTRGAVGEPDEGDRVGRDVLQMAARPGADGAGRFVESAGFVTLRCVEPLLEPLEPDGAVGCRTRLGEMTRGECDQPDAEDNAAGRNARILPLSVRPQA